MTSDNGNKLITLTPEQVISLVGHGVTQDQLDSTRRELSDKIDKNADKIDHINESLSAKIDNLGESLNAKIDKLIYFILGMAVTFMASTGGIIYALLSK